MKPHLPSTANLTDARHEAVLIGIASDKSVKEIARELGLTTKCIEYHLANLRKRVGVTTNIGLTHYAIRKGFVRARSPRELANGSPRPSPALRANLVSR